MLSLRHKRVFVAGHRGLVGAALCRVLAGTGADVLTVPRAQLDLRRQADVEAWFAQARPDMVVLAAARVGGIGANAAAPADFLYDNIAIAANVIHAAHLHDCEKLLFLGSSCIYPRDSAQPLRAEALLSGALEPTNEAYAVAKIAGVKLCQSYRRQYGRDFIAAMPCNLYGPGDFYDARLSHVIPALIVKMDRAQHAGQDHVMLWGTGRPLREFMYVDDLADGLLYLLQNYSDAAPINIGSGMEISIADLARMVADVVGFTGALVFDPAQPDGVPRKVLDCAPLRDLGWRRDLTPLRTGLARAYEDYRQGQKNAA